ncbi:MAG: hypothetical protein JKY96_00295 [Phycisphaerales bacterium]|nr:hypothetical protein [Phycisphaerales bacterium]
MPEHNEKSTDHAVGYRKPPKESQWKPGQSGNPKGRPKKIKDFYKLIDIELDETIRINDGGEIRLMPKRQIIVKALVNDALQGDARARKLILPILMKQQTVEGFEPDAADREAFAKVMKSFQTRETCREETTDE